MRLERFDHHVLVQHGVGVELLIRFHRPDVDVDAVTQRVRGALEFRAETLRCELEPDLEMRRRIAAVRVEMHRIRHDAGVGLQQSRSAHVEKVCIAFHFVHGPASAAVGVERVRVAVGLLGVVADDTRAPNHVMEHIVTADRLPSEPPFIVDVADFLHFRAVT